MSSMRRKDRMVTDPNEIESIIKKCKVLRMALKDSEGLYIVPLNFGYEFEGEELKFYFHGAKEGRKARFLKGDNRNVAFELDCNHALDDNEIACEVGFFYSSIVGAGKANIIEGEKEKVHAAEKLMIHQTGREYTMTGEMLKNVIIFEIVSDEFTCKQRIQI